MSTETVAEYRAWILSQLTPTQAVSLPVSATLFRAVAEPVRATYDLPMWPAAAMDGYAVRAADVTDACHPNPVSLRVIGEVAAGANANPELSPGTAARIMTGAPVPTTADAVVPFEWTQTAEPDSARVRHADSDRVDPRQQPPAINWDADQIWVFQPVVVGANVRAQGEDVTAGTTMVTPGVSMSAARAAALAAAGVETIWVHEAPRVALVATGSELQPIGATLARGQLVESNSLLLAGFLRESGLAAATVEQVGDDPAVLAARLAELARTHDAIITTGGVGPGKYDVVRLALASQPAIRATRVAMRPGQPQLAGRHEAGAFVFGLPGNPVAAAASFEMFVRPALRKLGGHTRLERPRIPATVTQGWRGREGYVQVLPVGISAGEAGLECYPAVADTRVSHSVGSHGATAAYALVEAERGDVVAGEQVQLMLVGMP